jgi:pilus assembly protein CpaE
MATRPLVLAVRANPELSTLLENVARPQGLVFGKINQYLSNGRCDLSKLPQDAPCIAFVDFTEDAEQGLRTAEVLSTNPSPKIWPVAVSDSTDTEMLIRSMRAGCTEFLSWPSGPDKAEAALNNVLRRVNSENDNTRNGRLVVFLGARGGVGVSTLAVNMAVSLAANKENNVLLADLQRNLGHIAIYLGLTNSGYSFRDVVGNFHRLDESLFQTMLARHSSGVSVLCSPDDCSHVVDEIDRRLPRDVVPISDVVERFAGIVRSAYNITIVDADPRTPEGIAIAQKADRVFLVASLDIGGMRDVARQSDALGRNTDIQRLVVTRAGKGVLTPDMLSNAASLPIAATIPDLSEPITAAINAGQPIPRQVRQFHEGLQNLLALVEDKPVTAATTAKKSFFAWRTK